MEQFAGEESSVVEQAIEAGVKMMVFPGVDIPSNGAMIHLSEKFPEHTRFCIGLHPTELGDNWQQKLDALEPILKDNRVAGIGETGIDLHWDDSNLEAQKEAFGRQLQWAAEHKLPLIIHCRDGVEATLEVISGFKRELPVMIFHSFTSGIEDVNRIREVCDPYFGINGVVTFKNAQNLRDALPVIGLDRMVLETDAPYLAPVPYRGQRNESKYIPLICNKIAETLGVSPEKVEEITDANASKIFKFHTV